MSLSEQQSSSHSRQHGTPPTSLRSAVSMRGLPALMRPPNSVRGSAPDDEAGGAIGSPLNPGSFSPGASRTSARASRTVAHADVQETCTQALFLTRIILGIDVSYIEGTDAVDLHDGFTIGPSVVRHASGKMDEASRRQWLDGTMVLLLS